MGVKICFLVLFLGMFFIINSRACCGNEVIRFDIPSYQTILITREGLCNEAVNGGKSLYADLNGDKKEEEVYIGMAYPGRISGSQLTIKDIKKDPITGYMKNINLMGLIYGDAQKNGIFDIYFSIHTGLAQEDQCLQIGLVDFDNDGIPEIIVAVGSHNPAYAYILKYTGEGEYFYKIIGRIQGQYIFLVSPTKAFLAPYGSRGFCKVYIYKNGKFIQIEDCNLKY